MSKPNGYVIYEGPSQLDGSPIVVVATGFKRATVNDKTGAMIQTWILRADMAPMEAIHSGADSSICGDCPHRGEVVNGKNKGRSCYVLAFQAPNSVYQAWRRGAYGKATDLVSRWKLLAGRKVRLGSYGDPAAVPAHVWTTVLAEATHWTGYTHQPQAAPLLRPYVMASADSAAEARKLQRSGWRTFRVMTGRQRPAKAETLCPASEESPAYQRAEAKGKPTPSCDKCGLCKGASMHAKSVAIYAHGIPGAQAENNVKRTREGRKLTLAKV